MLKKRLRLGSRLWVSCSVRSSYMLQNLGRACFERLQPSLLTFQYTTLCTYRSSIKKHNQYQPQNSKMSFTTHLTATNPSVSEAVNVLTSTVATEAASDNLETTLWKTWSDFLSLVAKTAHTTQQPFVDFLQALRKAQPPKTEHGNPYEIWGQEFKWENLPLFGPEVREEWDVGACCLDYFMTPWTLMKDSTTEYHARRTSHTMDKQECISSTHYGGL